MTRLIPIVCLFLPVLALAQPTMPAASTVTSTATSAKTAPEGFVDAGRFGFSPSATGGDNVRALQKALDLGGTIIVSQPGTYALASTVYIGSDTTLRFGDGVFIKKVDERGKFTQVILNKGALTRTYDSHITVDGLNLIVNDIDQSMGQIFGLRGQLGFFYIKDLHVSRFRCQDLGKGQFAIQICTFEDIMVDDVIVKGAKDGVHLGRGKRFRISNGVFQNGDDAIALNAHDYASSNPELGWIEDGVIDHCYDLSDDKPPVGFFVRILAGAWINWKSGMEVQSSDSVVSEGRVYRVQASPDGKIYTSTVRPVHATGSFKGADGIQWTMVQPDPVYSAGNYSRGFYPGATVPIQQGIRLDSIHALYEKPMMLFKINTPIDLITVTNSTLRNVSFQFNNSVPVDVLLDTQIAISNTTFNHPGPMELIVNKVPKKVITLKTLGSVQLSDAFKASVNAGEGTIRVDSDLNGLRK